MSPGLGEYLGNNPMVHGRNTAENSVDAGQHRGPFGHKRKLLKQAVADIQILELTLAGKTVRQIADELDVKRSVVTQSIRHSLDLAAADRDFTAQQLLTQELEKLSEIERLALAAYGTNGDPRELAICVQLHDKRVTLLQRNTGETGDVSRADIEQLRNSRWEQVKGVLASLAGSGLEQSNSDAPTPIGTDIDEQGNPILPTPPPSPERSLPGAGLGPSATSGLWDGAGDPHPPEEQVRYGPLKKSAGPQGIAPTEAGWFERGDDMPGNGRGKLASAGRIR